MRNRVQFEALADFAAKKTFSSSLGVPSSSHFRWVMVTSRLPFSPTASAACASLYLTAPVGVSPPGP